MTDIRQKIEPFLDSQAADRVGRYFHGAFTGRRFERLGGGGDREETANEFVAEDIVAVSLLGVTLDPAAVLQVLEGPTHERLCGLLASSNFPNHKDLWNVDESDVDGDSPANQLWDQLTKIHGIAQVIAGKLLARKRPRLIPIYDAHVDRAIAAKGDWWLSLRHTLKHHPGLVARLEEIRAVSGIGADISLIRVLDVSIWMAGGVAPVSPTRGQLLTDFGQAVSGWMRSCARTFWIRDSSEPMSVRHRNPRSAPPKDLGESAKV